MDHESAPSDAACELEIRVRYSECDPMGYLHHAKYFEFLELGRTELLRKGGNAYRQLEASGIYFVVAKAQCRFKAPAHYDDLLSLTTRVTRMTRARIDHGYTLKRNDQILCLADTTIACVDEHGKLMPIPSFLLRRDTHI